MRVRVIKKDDSKLKAVASITIDECFVVHDIKVIEGSQGYFIAMPSRKTPDGEYKDIVHPLNTEQEKRSEQQFYPNLKQPLKTQVTSNL